MGSRGRWMGWGSGEWEGGNGSGWGEGGGGWDGGVVGGGPGRRGSVGGSFGMEGEWWLGRGSLEGGGVLVEREMVWEGEGVVWVGGEWFRREGGAGRDRLGRRWLRGRLGGCWR